MRVGVGYSDIPDSASAGARAVRAAVEMSGRRDACDLVLLFCTARHDPNVLRAAAAAEAGAAALIYGGGAVGVITNETFGYAGDQVGAACFWFDGADCRALVEGGLLESEETTGTRLGKRLAALGTQPDSPVMLFYDAVDRSGGGMRLLMATRLLAGIEKGLGFLPELTGAGMQGDHVCTPSKQFVGDAVGEHCAMAFAFSDDIRIDSAIMHGCRPASPYYTVTRADGLVILEIDGKPAIEFMDGILGPAIAPEQYPFFLLFGINHGERWGEFDENNYASRLCFGLDRERGGIVMFEPDMVEGTEFQIMFRSFDFDYMQPKIEALFDRLDGREPVFAMYIDCAGRCAGYGGIDLEDACVVQRAVGARVPLLGIYSGVEIAPIDGCSRGLNRTGVFCLFSQGKSGARRVTEGEHTRVWRREKAGSGGAVPLEAALKLCERNVAKVLALDAQSIVVRHELEQKRRGFSLLAELSVSLRQVKEHERILEMVVQRMNAALNMQKTAVLIPMAEGRFKPVILQGYSEEENVSLLGLAIDVEPAILEARNPVLVTASDDENHLARLRKVLKLPYFVCSQIVVNDVIEGLLITGRTVEQMPFLSRLGRSDVETVQAISALLASLFVYQQLDDATQKAQIDALTGLYNRRLLESRVTRILSSDEDGGPHALIVIDFDFFKQVNDNYGHLRGDDALKALGVALRRCFRSSDVIARIGGDEFAVFCTGIGEIEWLSNIIGRLMKEWRSTKLAADGGATFHATLSVGMSIAPRDGLDYQTLFNKADIALYCSKRQGRNRFMIYDAATMGG
ncbi:MAG: GGDEF domain-containing protein [Candidatus Accumulibacter sp.]|jgi:diguanylate cyclase (GGDEF)-like protein|nr:GGDEF domain-containing protein [Accumulibacter sp.]